MKNFIVFSIISSMCIVLSSCETDAPPSIKEDISGVWVLDELYSITYQNETEVIHDVDIPVYSEQIEFLTEGLYIVGADPDPTFNEQFAFSFAGNLQNYEIDSTSSKIFGTWESHVNADGDDIIHFDKYVNGGDSFMFLDHVDENSLTMTMVVNQYYSNINIGNFLFLAEYQAAYDAKFYFEKGIAYEDGYNCGETVGYYDGYNETYSYEPDAENGIDPEYYIFSLFYGSVYANTFLNNYDPDPADVDFDFGFWDGYSDGYIIGQNDANQHDDGKSKSVTLTYKLTRK